MEGRVFNSGRPTRFLALAAALRSASGWITESAEELQILADVLGRSVRRRQIGVRFGYRSGTADRPDQ
jgi:hypothetical protein